MEKRYTLPDQPYIIVHPSRTAKSGKFDCTVMSLSLLLDYRPEDTKEHSFEVSLFAELFNEMLMRDFGFNIYRALYELPEKPKEEKEKEKDKKKKDDDKKCEDEKKKDEKKKEDEKRKEEKNKKDEKEKKEEKEKKSEERERRSEKRDEEKKYDKREEKRSEQENGDSEEDDEFDEDENKEKRKTDRERKRRDRPKMFTKDRNLLLSFIYFDQTHCGYIFEKDIEDLLYTLGLSLSRAQVRKLVGKVISRDSLHYRKLTDKPKDEDFIVIDDSEKDVNLRSLAVGNNDLLPVFDKEETKNKNKSSVENTVVNSEDGLVMFNGALVDVAKLMLQLERSDKARLDTESRMVDLKTENNKLSEKNNKSNTSIKILTGELKEYKEKLKICEDNLNRVTVSFIFLKFFFVTI